MQDTQVQSLTGKDSLEKGMASHSSMLAWRIPWAGEPGRLKYMGSQRIRQNWSDSTSRFFFFSSASFFLFLLIFWYFLMIIVYAIPFKSDPHFLKILFCFFILFYLCISVLEVSIDIFLSSQILSPAMFNLLMSPSKAFCIFVTVLLIFGIYFW